MNAPTRKSSRVSKPSAKVKQNLLNHGSKKQQRKSIVTELAAKEKLNQIPSLTPINAKQKTTHILSHTPNNSRNVSDITIKKNPRYKYLTDPHSNLDQNQKTTSMVPSTTVAEKKIIFPSPDPSHVHYRGHEAQNHFFVSHVDDPRSQDKHVVLSSNDESSPIPDNKIHNLSIPMIESTTVGEDNTSLINDQQIPRSPSDDIIGAFLTIDINSPDNGDVASLALKQITDHDYAPQNFVALTGKVFQMKEQLQFSHNNTGNNKTGWSLMTYVLSASLFSSCYDHDEDFSNISQIGRLRNSILTQPSHKEYASITQRSIICFEKVPGHIKRAGKYNDFRLALLYNNFYSQWSTFNQKIKQSRLQYYAQNKEFMDLFKELNIAPSGF